MFNKIKNVIQKIYDFLFSDAVANFILQFWSGVLMFVGFMCFAFEKTNIGIYFLGVGCMAIGAFILYITLSLQRLDEETKQYIKSIGNKDTEDEENILEGRE